MCSKKDFIGGEIIAVDKPLGWTSFDAVNLPSTLHALYAGGTCSIAPTKRASTSRTSSSVTDAVAMIRDAEIVETEQK